MAIQTISLCGWLIIGIISILMIIGAAMLESNLYLSGTLLIAFALVWGPMGIYKFGLECIDYKFVKNQEDSDAVANL